MCSNMGRFATLINSVLLTQGVAIREQVDRHAMVADLSALVSSEAIVALNAVTNLLLDPVNGLKDNVGEVVHAVSQQMDLSAAAKLIEKKDLPEDVANLVQKVQTDSYSEFSEESLAKARNALNELVEKAWIELDDKLFECKGFEDMNRESYAQANRDAMRLVAQINDLERVEAEAVQGVATKEQEILTVEAELQHETMLYNTEFAENKAELTIRQNDLEVFQFVLVFTKCPDATSLAQQNVKLCEYSSGPHAGHKTLVFADKAIADKYDKLLTPGTRRTLDNLLRSVEHTVSGRSLLQTDRQPINLNPSIKCGPEVPDCALLHDKLSLMWGDFKDKVDELTLTMLANQVEFNEIKANLNDQIALLTAAKAKFGMLLAEARSNMAADRQELKEKEVVKKELDVQYYDYMTKCKKRISWILGQDMCAMKVVRNAVLQTSTTCPSAAIQDCSMGDWVPASCSVSCDNTCKPSEPFKCGGWQTMTRTPVVNADNCGIKCPVQQKFKRCGQYLCPINCAMSEWSGWSACTADCGGGLQSKTRSIVTKPKNGGTSCNTVEESRPCNTGSCDRDCTLTAWKKWQPCSVACGGGMRERVRHVLIPTRGEGKCPTATSEFRLQKEVCNSKACVGDEVCIADQDLIIAVDGSGSLREAGFGILKNWVNTLIGKYKTQYYGKDKVRLGIVLFGNGIIMPDGKTVSPAINSQSLTGDAAAVQKVVNELPFKKGFTNMAQAFAMATDMFDKGSRAGAQHAVMLVTDGKPSFSFMTSQMAQQLEDKGIQRFFVVVSETPMTDNSMKGMKKWASQPWEANLLHVPGGLDMLEAAPNFWAQKALTMFCPASHSPSTEVHREGLYGYVHVKDSGWCGAKAAEALSSNVASSNECAKLAASRGSFSFILGKGVRRGYCYAGDKFTTAQYTTWRTSDSKLNPQCNAFNRFEKGTYCEVNHEFHTNKEKFLQRFTLAQHGGPEGALKACEAFCLMTANCWGCTVDCVGTCDWNAIKACGAVRRWPGSIVGDISQKGWATSELYDFYAIEPHEWTPPMWFCVASFSKSTVVRFNKLADAKTNLNAVVGDQNNRQMICEMSVSGAKPDPHTVGGENQGAGVAGGFYKWWWDWNDIHRMNAMCNDNPDCRKPPMEVVLENLDAVDSGAQ